MFRHSLFGAVLGLIFATAPAAAQAFDEPSFLPPRPGDDLGVYWTTQGDYGVQGIWRSGGLGVRGGWVSQPNNNAFMVGAEAFTRLLRTEAGLPFDFALTGGGGATFANVTTLRLVAGLSAGRELDLGGFVVQPYVHPRLALDLRASGDQITTSLPLLVDVGADLSVGEGVKIRFGTSIGEGIYGLGVAFRSGRGVAVR